MYGYQANFFRRMTKKESGNLAYCSQENQVAWVYQNASLSIVHCTHLHSSSPASKTDYAQNNAGLIDQLGLSSNHLLSDGKYLYCLNLQ